MKLSNLSVIFIIIIIPVILLLTYYISLQIDTINMQTAYRSKQLEATKEAIEAFEINTTELNESYSKTADSKRRDVMAAINTFSTGFANSLGIGGANKENILEYVPAIACTLYDGYYIYTPSEIKKVIKDDNGVTVFLTEKLVKAGDSPIGNYEYKEDDVGKILYKCKEGESSDGTYNGEKFTFDQSKADLTYSHILKPFSTYSARYKNGNIDVTVNYTLDNYITVYGRTDDGYELKSGYLIKDIPDNVQPENLSEKIWYEGLVEEKEFSYVYEENNTKVYFDGNTAFQVNSIGIRTDLSTTSAKYKKYNEEGLTYYQALASYDINDNGEIKEDEDIIAGKWYKKKGDINSVVGIDIDIKEDVSAINYYQENKSFSEWVEENLGNIKVGDIQTIQPKDIYGNVNNKIFNFEDEDPESDDSTISSHKREVIKQTLISNLNQSITSYSRNSKGEYNLPVLDETDWDHILRNVSIVTFVQGMPMGLKQYNNYAVATSTLNKEYVNPDEIYLSDISDYNTDEYYHMPYCEKLKNESFVGYRNIDYVAKAYQEKDGEDIKNKYYYKHENDASQACYYCLVQKSLYEEEYNEDKSNAYETALARERYIAKVTKNDYKKVDIEPEEPDIEPEKITIKYLNDDFVEIYKLETLKTGSYVITEDLPTKAGYKAKGWTYNGTIYNKGTIITYGEEITEIVLKATYEQEKIIIKYLNEYGTQIYTDEILKTGSYVINKTVPTKSGYTINGWEYNGAIYNKDATITYGLDKSEISLKANYTKIVYPESYELELEVKDSPYGYTYSKLKTQYTKNKYIKIVAEINYNVPVRIYVNDNLIGNGTKKLEIDTQFNNSGEYKIRIEADVNGNTIKENRTIYKGEINTDKIKDLKVKLGRLKVGLIRREQVLILR